MILVTGATGTIGSKVIAELVGRGAAVRGTVRDPASATTKLGGDVELVRGDLDDPGSLARAFEGVDAAFLLAPVSPAVAAHDLAMVDAAKKCGVRKLVKLSVFGLDRWPHLRFSQWHVAGEEAVRTSGAAWTVLRPAGFASNAFAWAPQVRARQPIALASGAGTQGVVDPRDVAAVAARALTSSEHDGKVYVPTGPELLSAADQVATIARVLGRPIESFDVSLSQFRDGLLGAGVPAFKEAGDYKALRELGRTHAMVVQDVVRVQNRIKALFRSRGVAVSGKSIYSEKGRETFLEKLPTRVAGRRSSSGWVRKPDGGWARAHGQKTCGPAEVKQMQILQVRLGRLT